MNFTSFQQAEWMDYERQIPRFVTNDVLINTSLVVKRGICPMYLICVIQSETRDLFACYGITLFFLKYCESI